MKIFSDGRVAVSIEYGDATLRLHDHVPSDDRPPYFCAGQVKALGCGVVTLSGFSTGEGRITRQHCWLILNGLHQEGYRIAYMERIDGHIAPFATLIEEGDFRGLWRVPLAEFCDRRRARKSSPAAAEATQ